MSCPQCGTDNRGESSFCRFCGYNLGSTTADRNSSYVPSVPPREASGFQEPYAQEHYQTPPSPPVYNPPPPPAWGQLACPRCGSPSVNKGGTPVWAIVVAVVLASFTCFLSLFLLLVKEPNRCLNCGNQFK